MNLTDFLQPSTLPAWIVSLPLAAAGLSVALPKIGKPAAIFTAAATSMLVVMLAGQVLLHGVIQIQVGGWPAPLGISLHADGLSNAMLAIACLIAGLATFYAAGYFGTGAAPPAFWPLWLFLWAALNALFLSGDIFNLYVTLELLGLAAVSLVALSRSAEALPAAMRYLLVSLTGSLSYLMGVALLYAANGTLDLNTLAAADPGMPSIATAFALMASGLIMKSALFPMHFWLPPAHANAPAPVSAVLSALVVKGSFYILMRLWLTLFEPRINPAAADLIGLMAAIAILWGSIQALLARRLKMLVAYSTVAQIGYIFLVFPLSSMPVAGQTAWQGGLYFVLSHACAKAAVFLAAGNVIYSVGHDRISELKGIVRRLPVSMFAFALAGVSLIGLPPSGGFVAKWLYLNAALRAGQWWWTVLILFGGLLSTAYIFRFFSRAFSYSTDTVVGRPVPWIMEWAAFLLASCAVVLGLTAPVVIKLFTAGQPF
jgi:formate hydrogenlyase subunit 3/multisubunit Na+/H+ antiporter MnhD subunit